MGIFGGGGERLSTEKEGGSVGEEGSADRLSHALCKRSGTRAKEEGMKVQNASLSLASTLFLPSKLLSSGKWVGRH